MRGTIKMKIKPYIFSGIGAVVGLYYGIDFLNDATAHVNITKATDTLAYMITNHKELFAASSIYLGWNFGKDVGHGLDRLVNKGLETIYNKKNNATFHQENIGGTNERL